MPSLSRHFAGLAFAALVVFASPASAGTIYDLNATSTDPGVISNFRVRFDDIVADGKLELGDMTTPKDAVISLIGPTFSGQLLTQLNVVPTTAFSIFSPCPATCFNTWFFRNAAGFTISAPPSLWTYTLTQVSTPSPVPLPPAFALFAFGIGVIGLLRWWRSRKAASLRRA